MIEIRKEKNICKITFIPELNIKQNTHFNVKRGATFKD